MLKIPTPPPSRETPRALSVLLAVSLVAPVPLAAEPPAEVNAVWLQLDLENAASLAAIELPKSGAIDELFGSTVGWTQPEHRRLGFGFERRVAWPREAGYVACSVSAVDWRGQLADLEIECLPSASLPSAAVRQIAEIWGSKADWVRRALVYRHANEAVWKRGRAEIDAVLGSVAKPSVPDELRAAFETLTDPHATLDVGERCSVDGRRPLGLRALETIEAARRPDILRAILRSTNPEGRIYAAQAILRWARAGGTTSQADAIAISKLAGLDLPILVCRGCIVTREPARSLIDPDPR